MILVIFAFIFSLTSSFAEENWGNRVECELYSTNSKVRNLEVEVPLGKKVFINRKTMKPEKCIISKKGCGDFFFLEATEKWVTTRSRRAVLRTFVFVGRMIEEGEEEGHKLVRDLMVPIISEKNLLIDYLRENLGFLCVEKLD